MKSGVLSYTTDYRLDRFVLDTRWEDLPQEVVERGRACFLDLLGALVVGSQSQQFQVGLDMAANVFGIGDVAVLGSSGKLSVMGAAIAMGHASNAFDIDDGHNIIRAHPGTSFIGGLLAAAYHRDVGFREFLTTLVVSYEATIRYGRAVMDYYEYPHSSGTFGAFGTAAGVGRLLGLSPEALNNALSVADFNAPLVPGIRSVEYPSMNKDGVPFGVMIGMLAIAETLHGFTGNKNLLEGDPYRHYLDDLGENFEILKLYFKPYPCCRWAHPAIDACLWVMEKHGISYKDIDRVRFHTFDRATRLSKAIPNTTDEAQYNIAYPVAAAIVFGDFGLEQVVEGNLRNPEVLNMMERVDFCVDPALDAKFPERRICRAEVVLKSGEVLESIECEPRGEPDEDIDLNWIIEKFRRLTKTTLTEQGQKAFVELVQDDGGRSMRQAIDVMNRKEYWKRPQVSPNLRDKWLS